MLKVLGGAIAKQDSDTNIHNYRRDDLCRPPGRNRQSGKKESIAGLIKGSFLHDVGKIAINVGDPRSRETHGRGDGDHEDPM